MADNAPCALILGILQSQKLPDRLTITDNVVSTEFLEVFGLLDSVPLTGKGPRSKGRAKASATLVQKENLSRVLVKHTQDTDDGISL